METDWVYRRQHLYFLRKSHPDWSKKRLSEAVKGSYGWTKKWCQRFDDRDGEGVDLFASVSRARHRRPEKIAEDLVNEILKIRDDPPEGLRRTPGPVTIHYFLGRSDNLSDEAKAKPPCGFCCK